MQHYYQNIEGWFDFQDLYARAVQEAHDGAILVEVGSWLGKSTSFLAVEAANSDKRIRIDAVDPWDGRGLEAWTRGRNLFAEFTANVRRSGFPVRPVRLLSDVAAAAYDDTSLDFVFLDAMHDYENVRTDLRAWLPKVKHGGVIAGHDWCVDFPGVELAVRDFLPRHEIRVENRSWSWRKAPASAGRWLREPSDRENDFLIYIPHGRDEQCLSEALNSVRAHVDRTVVIDQSPAGLSTVEWAGPVFRWQDPPHFTRAMNWIQQDAWRRGLPFFLFMHSDAVAGPSAIEQLCAAARTLGACRSTPWGALFTAYDALACFPTDIVHRVGCWDETFRWYVADVDYYNRLRWGGYPTATLSKIKVEHHASATLAALNAAEQAEVHADHAWAQDHYRHKWGCHWNERPEARRHSTPYDGRP